MTRVTTPRLAVLAAYDYRPGGQSCVEITLDLPRVCYPSTNCSPVTLSLSSYKHHRHSLGTVSTGRVDLRDTSDVASYSLRKYNYRGTFNFRIVKK